METPAQRTARLAARLEQSRRAAALASLQRDKKPGAINAARERALQELPPKLEWWQKERDPPKGPPGAPKPPSGKQWYRLTMELAWVEDGEPDADGVVPSVRRYPTREGVLSFVSFANAYARGPFSSLHFVNAINMAVTGRSMYGNAGELIAYSEGQELPAPDLKRHYAGLKKAAPARKARAKVSAWQAELWDDDLPF